MENKAKQRIKIGDILKIPLKNGLHTYAQVRKSNNIAFFALMVEEDWTIFDKLSSANVLFIICVDDICLTDGKWEKVGHKNLTVDELKNPPKYNNPIGSDKYFLYDNGQFIPASREQCIGLEVLSSWTRYGVECRLNEFFFGDNLPSHIKNDMPLQ